MPRLVLIILIVCLLELAYYLINKYLFKRTLTEINWWEWIAVILIIPSILAYLYYRQSWTVFCCHAEISERLYACLKSKFQWI